MKKIRIPDDRYIYEMVRKKEIDSLKENLLQEIKDDIRDNINPYVKEKMTLRGMCSIFESLENIEDESFDVDLFLENKSWAYRLIGADGEIAENEYFNIEIEVLDNVEYMSDVYDLNIKIINFYFV